MVSLSVQSKCLLTIKKFGLLGSDYPLDAPLSKFPLVAHVGGADVTQNLHLRGEALAVQVADVAAVDGGEVVEALGAVFHLPNVFEHITSGGKESETNLTLIGIFSAKNGES